MSGYVLGIDQSTQGTKALIFDSEGQVLAREALPHRQLINDKGWVEHDLDEIYTNVIQVVKNVVEAAGIDREEITCVGISNQRETSCTWYSDGKPAYNAVVWQCDRAKDICADLINQGYGPMVQERTGLTLSPYFPAGKIAWMIRNVEAVRKLAEEGTLHCGTVDAYLVYRLTGGKEFRTDYSNASRTQLFNLDTLKWDEEICNIFGIPVNSLPEVTDSDGDYGNTDFEGYLPHSIPIHGVLGDSHAALFAQGCLEKGMVKATYGTGSSIMMNVGDQPIRSGHGLVSSLAWSMHGEVKHVLEGNINYTGAVITWLKDDVKLISDAKETQVCAENANPEDTTYLVPAFSGLGAPYWKSEARGVLTGISRVTGKNEIVRAALDCITYQISDIVFAMGEDAGSGVKELRVDGGPTANGYLMQFQSDICQIPVIVPSTQELSCMGAAFAAGISTGFYQEDILTKAFSRNQYTPVMKPEDAKQRYAGWKTAVQKTIG